MPASIAKPSRFRPSTWFLSVFLGVFLVAFGSGIIITVYYLPKSYAATAHMMIGHLGLPPHTLESVLTQIPNTPDFDYVRKPMDTMASDVILNQVIKKLKLDQKWAAKYFAGRQPSLAETSTLLQKHLNVEQVADGQFFDITATSDDKKEAAAIADAVAEDYRDYRTETYVTAKESQIKVLNAQSQSQQKDINDTRLALASMKETSSPLFDVVAKSSDTIQKLQDQFADDQPQYEKDSAQINRLKQLSSDDLRATLPSVVHDDNLTDLLNQLETTQLSPETNQAVAQAHLDALNHKIDALITGLMFALSTKVASEKAGLDDLSAEIQNLKNMQAAVPRYEELQQKLAQLLKDHQSLSRDIYSAMVEAESPPLPAIRIDSAALGVQQVGLDRKKCVAVSALAGMFLGILAGSIAAGLISRSQKKNLQPALSGR